MSRNERFMEKEKSFSLLTPQPPTVIAYYNSKGKDVGSLLGMLNFCSFEDRIDLCFCQHTYSNNIWEYEVI